PDEGIAGRAAVVCGHGNESPLADRAHSLSKSRGNLKPSARTAFMYSVSTALPAGPVCFSHSAVGLGMALTRRACSAGAIVTILPPDLVQTSVALLMRAVCSLR